MHLFNHFRKTLEKLKNGKIDQKMYIDLPNSDLQKSCCSM